MTCDAEGEGTRVSTRYTLTALAPAAESAVQEKLAPAHFAAFMREWQEAIGKVLAADVPR